MINIIAYILIIYSTIHIFIGIATILGKFDPLLPKERKKLSAKNRKKAKMLNAISMIVTNLLVITLGVGMLSSNNTIIMISGILMAIFIVVMLPVIFYTEAKHLRK